MRHIIGYYLILTAVAGYAVLKGGKPEQRVASLLVVASLASTAVAFGADRNFKVFNVGVFLVDLALLCGLAVVASRAYRIWPIFMLAIQIITTAVHGSKAYDPTIQSWLYLGVLGKLAYPALLLLVFGTWTHQRRVRTTGTDKSWLISSAR